MTRDPDDRDTLPKERRQRVKQTTKRINVRLTHMDSIAILKEAADEVVTPSASLHYPVSDYLDQRSIKVFLL